MTARASAQPHALRRRDNLLPLSPKWLVYYYLAQFTCQLALLSSSLAGARVLFRSAAFGLSIVALLLTTGRRATRRHPAALLAWAVIAILVLETFHPDGGGPLAALATVAMYGAVLAPLVWVPRLGIDAKWFRRVVILVWAFQFASAFMGALQVYYPATFQPSLSVTLSDSYISSLQITLSNGAHIVRPTGLTDTPGGAAAAGTYSILLGLGLLSSKPRPWMVLVLLLSILTGMFTLYLCQIRSLIVMVCISIGAMAAFTASQGRFRRAIGTFALVGLLASGAFIAAVSVGGDDVINRLQTLVSSSPTEVYYNNRGIFLEHTLSELLPLYPLGAGLGRWGMLSNYFARSGASTIYVEIQWTGWLLDGGVLLIAAYSVMLILTLLVVIRMARKTRLSNDLTGWAAMLIGYDVGAIALTFNFPVFASSMGLDFWVLNVAFFTMAVSKTPVVTVAARGSTA